jgi:hypothetical protein
MFLYATVTMANQGRRCGRAGTMIHRPSGGAVISSERPSANASRRLVGRSTDILSCMPVTDKVRSSTICECGIYISSFYCADDGNICSGRGLCIRPGLPQHRKNRKQSAPLRVKIRYEAKIQLFWCARRSPLRVERRKQTASPRLYRPNGYKQSRESSKAPYQRFPV